MALNGNEDSVCMQYAPTGLDATLRTETNIYFIISCELAFRHLSGFHVTDIFGLKGIELRHVLK